MFIRQKMSLIVIGIFVPVLAVAQFGIIEGKITDKRTGEPLPGANVIVRHTILGAAASRDGSYCISNVRPGKYEVIASMMGYKSISKEVEVTAGETHRLNFELKESAIEMPGIVVTGTRTPRYIKDTPVHTEVITHQRIVDKGAATFYEAMEGEPGIRVEQQCSYCNFSIIRMQGLESGHCQIMIDGEPTFAGLTGVYGLQQIPAANIEKVEVVKGAGSALYGSSAIAGVINIITKRPKGKPTAKLVTRFGEDNTNLFSIDANYVAEKMDMALNAQKSTGNEIDENHDNLTDRVKSDNVTTGVRVNWYDLLGDDQLSFSGKTINEMRQGGELTNDAWQNPFAAASEHIRTSRYETTIGYKKRFSLGNELGVGFTYVTHNRNATNDAFLSDYLATHGDTCPPSDLMKPYIADENIYVVNVNYSHSIEGKHNILAGFQYNGDRMKETGMYCTLEDDTVHNIHIPAGYAYSSKSKKYADNYSLYLQGEFSIMKSLEAVIGARYDIHHSEDEFAGTGKVVLMHVEPVVYDEQVINPRLALKFEPLANLILRGSIGTGFRVPYTFEEDLHLCSGSPRVFKPKGLEPEESVSRNLTADWTMGNYEVSANLFRTNLKNKIGFVDARPEYKSRGYDYEWNNIGDAYTQGIELGLKTFWGGDFRIDVDFTYTDARYKKEREDWMMSKEDYKSAWLEEYPDEGEELFNEWWSKYEKAGDNSIYIPRVPEMTGGIAIKYTPGEFDFVFDVAYTGSMYIDYFYDEAVPAEIKHTDPFFVVNSRIAYNLSRGVKVFVGARNLLDYYQEDRRPDDAAFMYAPYTGRVAYGGIEIKL